MRNERYNRQLILKGFGEAAQHRLSKARVLVIGAGGLGCPALQYLAAAGTGKLGIADDDTVSLSNLHRQILFTTADLGKLKAEVAAERLRQMNPETDITAHVLRIGKHHATELFQNYDLVLDGTDNFETRYLINDTCAVLKKPLIFAAVSGFEGQLAVFNVDDQNGLRCNYRDLFPVPPKADEVPNCEDHGVIGVLPGVMGVMAATEVIKLLCGIGKPLINRLLHLNALTWQQHIIGISPGQGYTLSGRDFYELSSGHTEIDALQMQALQQGGSTLCIDVRERHEQPKLDKGRFLQVPMSEFSSFLEKEIAEEHIIVVCQHGIRSVAAAEALEEKYGSSKQIYSLKGGIVKWKEE